jgi:hypothetical protein
MIEFIIFQSTKEKGEGKKHNNKKRKKTEKKSIVWESRPSFSVANYDDETNLEQSLSILQKFPTYPCSH